jgi:DNA replication initiation complex subunit (GINS family)
MSQPNFSNSNFKLKYVINNEKPLHTSAWLNIPNGWDDDANRPIPMTPEQKDVIDRIHQMIADNNVNINLVMKVKTGGEASEWPLAAQMRLFPNTGTDAPKVDTLNYDVPF